MSATTLPKYRLEVVAKGDPEAMGFAQGVSLRDKIHASREILAQLEAFRLLQPRWMPYALYRRISETKATRFLGDQLARDFPDARLRLKGISEGSGISMGVLFLINALEPMLSAVSNCTAVPVFGGCSAVAVRGRRSATGEPVIVRNFDYLPLVQPLYTLRHSQPRSGLRSLDFTVAPFAGTIDGVNEQGLCITYNYAYTTDVPGKGTAPISILIAETLERCSTVIEAADWIGSRPRWGGGILMLADAGGDIAHLELSSTRRQLRRPRNGADVLFHSNAFATDEMCRVQIAGDAVFTDRAPGALRGRRVHESAQARDCRFKQLLDRDRPLDLEDLTSIMADHGTENLPGDKTICMHSDYWNTTAALQLFPVSRRMRVAFDSACHAKYEDITL